MIIRRSRVQDSSRKSSSLCLATMCMGIVLSLFFVQRRVAADESCRPQWVIPPAAQSAGAWVIQQQTSVVVEVDVRSASELALLQSMGYSCGIGRCTLELPDGEERALMAQGLRVHVTERAIKLSGGAPPGAPGVAVLAEAHADGSNYSDVTIPNPFSIMACGNWVHSDIVISGAPPGATVTKVVFSLLIPHPFVSNLNVEVRNDQHAARIWDRWGGSTDEGDDDDTADDDDIEYIDRPITSNFDGDPVNQTWKLYAQDCVLSNSGHIDYWQLAVYYDCTPVMPGTPSAPSPASGATSVSPNADLDWADTAQATSYDVYFGTLPPIVYPPPKVGSTTTSNYALSTLACDTHYYWRIAAKNSCGTTYSSYWDFATGCCLPGTPSGPSPANGATGQPLSTTLWWTEASGATSYDIYFGTTSTPPKIVAYRDTTNWTLGVLTCGTRYYWKVVARNSCGETSGPLWSFDTTCCLPSTPSGPSPVNGAINQPVTVDLDWEDTPLATSYDVYFGESTPPEYHGHATSSSYSLPTLSAGKHYYWKIVAINSCGSTDGPIWDLGTAHTGQSIVDLPIVLKAHGGPVPTPEPTPVPTPWCLEPENNTTVGACGPLVPGEKYYDLISSPEDEYDWYYFDLPGRYVVEAWLRNIPPGCNYDLYLKNADGTTLIAPGSDAPEGEHIDQYGPVEGGRYYLGVVSIDNTFQASLQYELEVDFQ